MFIQLILKYRERLMRFSLLMLFCAFAFAGCHLDDSVAGAADFTVHKDEGVVTEPPAAQVPGERSFEDDRFNDVDLNQFFNKHLKLREKLLAMRTAQIDEFFKESAKEKPNYFSIAEKVSDESKQFISGVMEEVTEQLPFFDANNMAFVAAGSLARRDSGFFTDIEGFLLQMDDKPMNQFTGKQWSQAVSDLLFSLQEHPDIGVFGLRLDEADSSPFHNRYFARRFKPDEEYCSVLKSMGGPDAILHGKKLGFLDKQYYARYYPFEGAWTNMTTPDKVVQYLLSFEKGIVPFVTESFPETPEGGWTKENPEPAWPLWVKQEGLLNTKEINSDLIYNRMTDGQCVANMNDTDRKLMADAIEKRLMSTELSVLGKGPYNLRAQVLLTGSPGIYDYFLQRRAEMLTKDRAASLVKQMTDKFFVDIKTRQESSDVMIKGILPGAIDIKRTFFRLFEQFATNMGVRYLTLKQSQTDNIDELVKMQVLGSDFAERLLSEMNFLTGVRLYQLAVNGEQLYQSYTSQESFDTANNKLKGQLTKAMTDLNAAKAKDPDSELSKKLTFKVVDLKRQTAAMEKLNPSREEPVLTSEQITHLKEKTIPIMQELFKRWVAFEGFRYVDVANSSGKVTPIKNPVDTPNPAAFHDDFNVSAFDLNSVGLTPMVSSK